MRKGNQPTTEPGKNPPEITKIKTGEKEYKKFICKKCTSDNLVIEVERISSRWYYQTKDKGFKPAITATENEYRIIRGYCSNCGEILSRQEIQDIAKAEDCKEDFKRAYNI